METGFVIYQPGGTATDTTFTDFGSLTTYIQSVGTSVQAWTIFVDGYFSDYNAIIQGTFPMPVNVTFVGVYGSIQGEDELTTFLQLGGGNVSDPSQDCVFSPFPTNLNFVNILPYSINVASPVITVDGSVVPQLVLSLQASALVNDGVGSITTPMISAINGANVVMTASEVSYFYTMQNPVISVDATSIASLCLSDFGAVYNNPFSGVTAGSINVYVESSNYLDPTFLSNSAVSFHFDSVAPQVAYTPGDSANWTLPNPTTVQAALDDLAANDLVTWAGDLSGSTNTSQHVAAISGNAGAGGSIPVNATSLSFSASEASPSVNQTALPEIPGFGSAGQNLSVIAQAGQAAVPRGGHSGPPLGGVGGTLVLSSGAGGIASEGENGAPGEVSVQIGGTTFLNVGVTGEVTLASLGAGVVQSSAAGLLSSTPITGDSTISASGVMKNTGLQSVAVPIPSGSGTVLTYNSGALSWTAPSAAVIGYTMLYGGAPQTTLTTSGTYYEFGAGTGSVAWGVDSNNLTTSATGFIIPNSVGDGYYSISFTVSFDLAAADRLTFRIYQNGIQATHASFASNGGTATQAVSVSGQIVTFANVADAFTLQVTGSVNNLAPTWLYSTLTATLL
jgi:hypothetical protein